MKNKFLVQTYHSQGSPLDLGLILGANSNAKNWYNHPQAYSDFNEAVNKAESIIKNGRRADHIRIVEVIATFENEIRISRSDLKG